MNGTNRIATIFALFTISTLYASAVSIGNFSYRLDSNRLTAEVTGTSISSGDMIIPSSVTYGDKTYRVTSIGDNVSIGKEVGDISCCLSCQGLTASSFDAENENFVFYNNAVYNQDKSKLIRAFNPSSFSISSNTTEIGPAAFYEDHHFDVLRTIAFPHVDVIGIRQFLEELEKM